MGPLRPGEYRSGSSGIARTRSKIAGRSPVKRVLIPIDGSEAALRAVAYAVSLVPVLREPLEVLLLNVQHLPVSLDLLLNGRSSEVRILEQPLREAGAGVLAPAQALLEKTGITCSAHVEIGDPAPTISRFARTYHCEEIIMATRGLGTVTGLILGSVANKVLHLTTVPVTLVK